MIGFHGLPNSRLVHFRDAPEKNGVRLILPDRPGFGRSDPQPGRSLLDWPDDVAALADALGLGRFAVVGISAGGPHAEACAWAMPDRVAALGIVSAAGPIVDSSAIADGLPADWIRIGRVARADRGAAEQIACDLCGQELELLHRDPEAWLASWEATAPRADQRIIADPVVRAMYVESCAEATLDGYVAELLILAADRWGFPLEEIEVPAHLWHGGQDATVPVAVARYVASAIPHCSATIYPGDGHLLVHEHEGEILGTLAAELS